MMSSVDGPSVDLCFFRERRAPIGRKVDVGFVMLARSDEDPHEEGACLSRYQRGISIVLLRGRLSEGKLTFSRSMTRRRRSRSRLEAMMRRYGALTLHAGVQSACR